MHKKVIFKEYNMDQLMLPMDISSLISKNHIVRIVNEIIDGMNLEPIIAKYKGGGTSAYNPIMMIKAIVYGYTQKIFSGRMLAKAIRENINFMWISGNNRPDFRTINTFRSQFMPDIIDEVFTYVVQMLEQKGYLNFDKYFLDGTKIEANANKYSFVWKKSVEKNNTKLQDKVKELLKHIKEVSAEEDKLYGDKDLEELGEDVTITSEELKNVADKINEALLKKAAESSNTEPKIEDKNDDDKPRHGGQSGTKPPDNAAEYKFKRNSKESKLLKMYKKISSDFLPRLVKYEQSLPIFGSRNSYSKTDHDATFMRMKEDHMKNGQLKPGYNIQFGTNNRFILNYTVHQNRTDSPCMIPHLKDTKRKFNKHPKAGIMDSGYGSEENYEYINENKIENFVKFSMFHKEKTKKFKNDIFRVENLKYDKEQNLFTCPNNKRLIYSHTKTEETENGYKTTRDVYTCEDCSNCNFKEQCTKAKGNRSIAVSHRLNEYKAQARKNLDSEIGIDLRRQRATDVEPTIGGIKFNMGFKRFSLRGIKKVSTEMGILSIAYNLRRAAILEC